MNLKEKERMDIKGKESTIKVTKKTQATNTQPNRNVGFTIIDKTNIHLVSEEFKGLIQNPMGAWDLTPLFQTWVKNTQVQQVKRYNFTPKIPQVVQIKPHSEPSDLNLNWSHDGEWDQIVCILWNKTEIFSIRIERYVDLDGRTRRAVCYGDQAEKLRVWFKIEDIMTSYKGWTPSTTQEGLTLKQGGGRP